MGRKTDTKRIEEIGRYVDMHPGSKPIDIARGLGLEPSRVTRLLPVLQDEGIFTTVSV